MFFIGIAAGPGRRVDISTKLGLVAHRGFPWNLLCLDLRKQVRPHILRPSHAYRTAAPGRVPLPAPFPIYQLVPRKGTPTVADSSALREGKKTKPSQIVSFIPPVIKCAVILPCKNQYGLLIHYLKSPSLLFLFHYEISSAPNILFGEYRESRTKKKLTVIYSH